MKNKNLLNWLWNDSHEKQSPQRFARYAAMLIMLLTIGVGQMWAEGWICRSTGASGNQATKNIGDKLNSSGWDYTFTTNGGWDNGWVKVYVGTSTSSYTSVSASWVSDDGSNKNVSANIGNVTFDKSGKWYAVGVYKNNSSTVYTTTNSTWTSNTTFSMGSNSEPYWTVNPPAVSSFAVSTTGSNILSGTGTSADPYIIAYNGSLALALSGSKAKTDANSSLQYNTSGTWNTTTSRTISSITSSEKTSVTVKMRCYNSTASLSGTESTKTIYYKAEASYNVTAAKTPSAGGSVTPTSATKMGTTSGGDITASPNTGYTFTSWAITSGSGYFGTTGTATTSTTANTKFRPSATATVTATFTPKTYSVTLDGNGGSDGSATATYNSSTLTSFTGSSRASYDLNGYFTATSGGTKVINADGTLVANVSGYTNSSSQWIMDNGVELHAQWTYNPVTYTVTYAVGTGYTSYGSLSAKNTSTSAAIASGSSLESGTGVTFTATPNTGYVVEGWYTNPACTSGKHDEGSNTYSTTLSGNITVYVKFVEKTWSVAFAAGTGGTVTTPAATPQTVGQVTGISIEATPATGYTFNTWTITSGSGSFTSAATTNSNTFKPTAASTITASFNETKSTITVTTAASSQGTLKFGSTSKSWGATASLGVATTQEITATAAAGFTFVRWDLSGAAASASTLTNATITLKADGSGSTGTATAVFAEDLSSPWVLKGGTNITGDNWATEHAMTKKTGHSTENVAYYTANISSTNSGTSGSADAWSFKLIKNSTWYGLTADGSYWWGRSTSANQSLNTSGANIQICADVAGTYEIKVDYSTATPKITVTFPTKYTVTYSVSPSGAANAITTSPSVASGGSVAAGTSMTFTHAAAKTGYSWYRWENGSGSSLGTGNTYTTAINANTTVVAKYTENTYNVTATASTGGSVTPASATAMGQITGGDITASPNTGYNFTNWTITSGSGYFGASGTSTTSTTANTKFRPTAAATIQANFTPKQTTITLNNAGATTSGTTEVTATYDAEMPAITLPTKTGYTFGGYWGAPGGSGPQYYNADGSSTQNWDNENATYTLYAKWTAKTTTITLDQTGAASAGSITTRTGTYNADMPVITGSGSLPTAPQGYAFMGYYDALEPLGTKYYNADGTSAHTWDKEDASFTLHAYFKQAEITALGLSEAVIAPNETITVTPTIDPTPVGPTIVCWQVQYSNGTALPSQPTFTPGAGNAVSFPVPSASATYIIQAILAKGSDCPADPGNVLSTRTTTFQVAGAHDVTVKYMCGDLTIKTSEVLGEIRPLTWSDDITAPTITGYTFARWDAGDGVTIKDGSGEDKTTSTSSTIKIKAVYDGTLTALYTKKRLIFFNNTLGWSSVNVYFYKNDSYWQTVSPYKGSGANTAYTWTNTPYSEGKHGTMTQIEGTNIWYFDAQAAGVNASYDDVVFTEAAQHGYDYFYQTKAVRRGDYNSTQLPMFVPLKDQTPDIHNETGYTSSGYWMNYPENTGYSLLIYNQKTKAGATKLYEIPFEFTEDFTMPMELVVDLEAGQTYGFEIKRADGEYYGNNGTMTANITNWAMETDRSSYCGLQTTAAGNYTFRFYYSSSNYRMDVTYPVAVNDYRIVYTDLATWSKDAHTASWSHPSRVITKNSSATETKKDTVSFFWSYGSTPAIKYQKCTGTGAGSVSWNAGTSIDVSGFSSVLTKKGVYNFIFEQPAGGASISLVGVEPYTGNYYIRTDCAGNSKWENFRTSDHQMTYSDYAEANSGYSHYYTHWVTSGTNVKFCIANDYSQCITDTLSEDYGTVIANITAEGNDGSGRLNSASANIRFMWNQSTNKVSRAYIGGSTNISDRFLVLEGDSKMYDKDGSALSISGLNPNEANLIDDQNFVYEREIQVNTKARAKLTAKYNSNIQYFKGSEGAFAEGTTIELLGGDAIGKHTMRIVYDFKTNRLVTAYVPSGTIDADIAINADLMIVREHQGAGQQLLFEGAGKLSKVHTVYGVMRFNRWTLNNKSTADGHSPVGDPKSIYERSLYWISFPFNVNLSDVFGFGTYGVDWIIEYYDGAERATNGYWIDSDGFWKMVMPAQRADFTLEAGKGYVLAIDVDAMKDNNETFWANNIEQVELFFPSATNVENITQTTAHTIVPEHECTIDRRTDKSVNNINKDRTKADSHWNMIGIPSYANYGATLTSDEEGTHTITWNSNPYTNDLPFLYEWNMTDDSYTVQSGTTYPFKAMHAYMVQYHGDLYWSLASATPTPSPIVARRAYAEKPQNAEFRLELQQNEKMVDQTFVNMKDAEEISAGFKFDEDLCKEFNAGKANIYTLIENYLPAAGNTLPMSDQTTLVPVGVKTTAAGEYTFAMPESTNGVSVVLIDNIAGTRTNLALSDYTVSLGKGDLSDRFMLEIAPIKQMPTGIDAVSDQHSAVRKVMIDGILYIVKDGKVFDARGAKVK